MLLGQLHWELPNPMGEHSLWQPCKPGHNNWHVGMSCCRAMAVYLLHPLSGLYRLSFLVSLIEQASNGAQWLASVGPFITPAKALAKKEGIGVEELLGENPIVINEAKEEIKAEEEPSVINEFKEEIKAEEEPIAINDVKEEPIAINEVKEEPIVIDEAKEEIKAEEEPIVINEVKEEPIVIDEATEEIKAEEEPIVINEFKEELIVYTSIIV